MKVIRYKDPNGNWFMEIVSKELKALLDLQEEHNKLGRKTYFNVFNDCDQLYALTVAMPCR